MPERPLSRRSENGPPTVPFALRGLATPPDRPLCDGAVPCHHWAADWNPVTEAGVLATQGGSRFLKGLGDGRIAGETPDEEFKVGLGGVRSSQVQQQQRKIAAGIDEVGSESQGFLVATDGARQVA